MWLLRLAILLTAVFWPNQTSLAGSSINNVKIEARVHPDGRLQVSETLDLDSSQTLNWTISNQAKDIEVLAGNRVVPSTVSSGEHQQRWLRTGQASQVWQINYMTRVKIIRNQEYDRIYWKMFHTPLAISDLSIKLVLPEKVELTQLSGNLYSLNGLDDSRTTVETSGLTFTARNIKPNSLLTLNANWPKNTLPLTVLQQWRLTLEDWSYWPWLILGSLLPLISLIFLLTIIRSHRQSRVRAAALREKLPSQLSPVLVGLLVRKKIEGAAIVAMLIDLCQRGYLVIIKKNKHFYFGQKKTFDQVERWEAPLLAVIFPEPTSELDERNIKSISHQILYSPEVRQAFSHLYDTVTRLNYFTENPHNTRVRYKLIGLIIYILSSVAIVWSALAGLSPVILIPLAGSLLMSFTIIRLSSSLISYTPQGYDQRKAWLEFANYLKQPNPVTINDNLSKLFDRYLPYAVALGVSRQWAKRFDLGRSVVVQPDWLVNFRSDTSAQNYTHEVTEFTATISDFISAMHGPLVS